MLTEWDIKLIEVLGLGLILLVLFAKEFGLA